MRKSNGKYYVNGDLATGSYKNKYYKDGELYTGIRKSNGKYYVNGVLANGTYDGVKYIDGVAQSDSEDPSETEEKLTEGEFRTNSGKLQHCEALLYSSSMGNKQYFKRDNKYYYLDWVDYTGKYEGKLYESGKAVDYKVRTKNGDLFTGWAIYEDVIPNAATEFYHLTTGKSHNLVYVENGIVKQYYVYEKMEDHSWCNGCGADMEVSPYWSSAGVNPALDDHKEHDHPQFDHQSFNGGPVYKYTNNGKTYWVTASNGREYRWTGTEYVPYWNVGGTECLDTSLPKELTHLNDTGKIPDVVYSSDDWKIGQCSIVLVNKDVVLK